MPIYHPFFDSGLGTRTGPWSSKTISSFPPPFFLRTPAFPYALPGIPPAQERRDRFSPSCHFAPYSPETRRGRQEVSSPPWHVPSVSTDSSVLDAILLLFSFLVAGQKRPRIRFSDPLHTAAAPLPTRCFFSHDYRIESKGPCSEPLMIFSVREKPTCNLLFSLPFFP